MGVISAIAKFADDSALFLLLHLCSSSSTPSPPLHLLLPCSISSSPLHIFGFTLRHHRRAPRPTGHRDRRAPQLTGTATDGHRDRRAPQPTGTATDGHRNRRGPSWTKVISIPHLPLNSLSSRWFISIFSCSSSPSSIYISQQETSFSRFQDVTSAAARALDYYRSTQESGVILRFSTAPTARRRLLAL